MPRRGTRFADQLVLGRLERAVGDGRVGDREDGPLPGCPIWSRVYIGDSRANLAVGEAGVLAEVGGVDVPIVFGAALPSDAESDPHGPRGRRKLTGQVEGARSDTARPQAELCRHRSLASDR
jgi:hypothetical protein